jgi:hypothetical protein
MLNFYTYYFYLFTYTIEKKLFQYQMMFISCNSSMTHATSGGVTDYPSGGLSVGHVALSLVLCIVLCFLNCFLYLIH